MGVEGQTEQPPLSTGVDQAPDIQEHATPAMLPRDDATGLLDDEQPAAAVAGSGDVIRRFEARHHRFQDIAAVLRNNALRRLPDNRPGQDQCQYKRPDQHVPACLPMKAVCADSSSEHVHL